MIREKKRLAQYITKQVSWNNLQKLDRMISIFNNKRDVIVSNVNKPVKVMYIPSQKICWVGNILNFNIFFFDQLKSSLDLKLLPDPSPRL